MALKSKKSKLGKKASKKTIANKWVIRNSIMFFASVIISIVIGVFYFIKPLRPESNLLYIPEDIYIGFRVEEIYPVAGTASDFSTGNISLENFAYRINTPVVLVTLDYIYVSPSFLSLAQRLCFQTISIRNNDIYHIEEQRMLNQDVCVHAGTNYLYDQSTNYVSLLYDPFDIDYFDPYYYPFDSRAVDFTLLTRMYIRDESNQDVLVPPFSHIGVDVTAVKSSRDIWKIGMNGSDGNDLKLRITLRHSPYYQLFTVLILFAMWIGILSLVFLSRNDNLWEVTIGIFGLWGIQGALLPENAHGYMLISDFILYLYILLAFVLLFLIVKSINKKWNGDQNSSFENDDETNSELQKRD